MALTSASTPRRGGSRTGTCVATRWWRWRSRTRTIRTGTCRSAGAWRTSPSPARTPTSTRWPRNTWARTSTRTVSPARCASSTRSRRTACRRWGEALGRSGPAVMIGLDGVSKSYGGQELLRDCSWRVGRGERIGLVGPNGAGKTTLCRILAGVEEPDEGHVHLDSGITVGYLPQEVAGGIDRTVLAEALSGFDEVWELEAELERLADAMARPDASPGLTHRSRGGAARLR